MRLRLNLAAALPLLAAGCGTVVDPPPHPGPAPVVEALLIGGSSSTTFRLTWADQGEAPLVPIAPADVRLTLASDIGQSSRLTPRPDTVALYVASIAILAGHRYRLEGMIASWAISAATTVPTSFTIDTPNGEIDTATPFAPVPFRWRSTGATVFAADFAIFGQSAYHHTKDTMGVFRVDPRGPGVTTAEPSELTIWAMNADADRYLYNLAAPQNNILGGLGVLGGALLARRTLRWH